MVTKFNLKSEVLADLIRSIIKGNNTQKLLQEDLKIKQNTLSERITCLIIFKTIKATKEGRNYTYSIDYNEFLILGLKLFGHRNTIAKRIVDDNPLAVEVFKLFLEEYSNKEIYLVHTGFLLTELHRIHGSLPKTRKLTLEEYLKYFESWFRANEKELRDIYPHCEVCNQTLNVLDFMKEPNIKNMELTTKVKEKFEQIRNKQRRQ